jgi:hypothetical protein
MVTGDDGRPAQLDGCEPLLEVAYDPTHQPYDARADVDRVVATLAAGLGRPVEVVDADPGARPSAPGETPTIVVSWEPGTHEGTQLGKGGPLVTGGVVVAGTVVLNAAQPVAPGAGPGSWGSVILHELGHAVNLDHVDDPDELMFPTLLPERAASWGSGDLNGLAAVTGTCGSPTR